MTLKKWMAAFCCGALLVGLTACGDKDSTAGSAPADVSLSPHSELAEDKDNPVNYSNFEKLALGGSLKDAEALFGGKGKKVADRDKTTTYAWTGNGLGNLSVTLADGKIIEKAQTDLTDRQAKLTPEVLSQVGEGMSLDQLKALLGEPALVRQAKGEDGKTEVTYEWKQADGAAVTALFIDNQPFSVTKPAV